jgi:fructokinase
MNFFEGATLRIGVDLGGTKIEAIALDGEGRELRRERVPTPRGDYAGTVRSIGDLVRDIEAHIGAVGSVGVGIPGTIIRSSGLVKNANSTWLNGMPLEVDLGAELGREVRCANDANCFAVSEAVDGAAAGKAVVFGVIVGTGCGGGVALHGQAHNGPNGLAGEWGHTPLPWAHGEELPGPDCYCGKHGCMENWISGTGLAREFAHVTGRPLRGEEIVAAAAAGDVQAQAALDRLEERMARGLAVIIDVLDPDVIVLGGGLSKLDRLYRNLPGLVRDMVFGGGAETPILRNMHGDSSGVRGAAWLWNDRA